MPTVIVTGAGRGLGLAITKSLLSKGSDVVAISRNVTALDALSNSPSSGKLHVVSGDVTDTSLWQRVVTETRALFNGGIDGLVLNAGVLDPVSKIATVDLTEARRCFDVNFFSLIVAIQACLPALRQSGGTGGGGGKIVMISSGAAVSAPQTWSMYGCTKAALNHLAQDLANEEPAVTTIALRPGVVDTDMQRGIRETHAQKMDPEQLKKFTQMYADRQLVDPHDVGAVIAQLALTADKSLSGQFVNWVDVKADYS